MQAIVYAFIAYFAWGTGLLFEAIAARKLKVHSLLFWSYIISLIIGAFYVPFALSDLLHLTWQIAVINFILILVVVAGALTYYQALKQENRALVGTIASSFPIVTVVFSTIFLGERLSVLQILATTLVFLGLILVSVDIKEIKSKNFGMNTGILFALLTMLLWGAYFAFIKIPIQQIGWFWPNYFTFFLLPFIFFYAKFSHKKIEHINKTRAFISLFLSVILIRIAEFSYNLGISKGLVTIVAPIAGANPTLFVILAFLFLKDPIKKQQIVGIITALIGIVWLSFI